MFLMWRIIFISAISDTSVTSNTSVTSKINQKKSARRLLLFVVFGLSLRMSATFLKISGDYANWSVYKKSVIICDVTEMFIKRALPRGCRTIDQMRQAARSCKQNIVEGVSDGTVSAEMCIKLLGVARGSVRELREDYADFLRQHRMEIWQKDDPRTVQVRNYSLNHYEPADYVDKCERRSDETVANIMLTLTYQMDAMLAKVLVSAQEQFVAEGGIKEAMTRARKSHRGF